MKKYYIQIYDLEKEQITFNSEWFDTEEQALAFAKNKSYYGKSYYVDLMVGEFENNKNTSIKYVRTIRRKI